MGLCRNANHLNKAFWYNVWKQWLTCCSLLNVLRELQNLPGCCLTFLPSLQTTTRVNPPSQFTAKRSKKPPRLWMSSYTTWLFRAYPCTLLSALKKQLPRRARTTGFFSNGKYKSSCAILKFPEYFIRSF